MLSEPQLKIKILTPQIFMIVTTDSISKTLLLTKAFYPAPGFGWGFFLFLIWGLYSKALLTYRRHVRRR